MSFLGFELADVQKTFNFFKIMMQNRFVGSSLGVIWAFASPVLMLGIFTFVFGFVFRSKLPGAETSISYVIWLISGYGPWLSISEGISSGANSIIGQANLIKNMKLKPELLTIASVALGSIPLIVAMIYLAGLMVVDGSMPNWAWLILPFVIILQFIFITGIGLCLAALAVFIRDIVHIIPNLLLMLMFASPIIYPITAFPGILQKITLFNPLYLLSECYRQPLLYGTLPSLWSVLYLILISAVTFYIGLYVFRRLSVYFEGEL